MPAPERNEPQPVPSDEAAPTSPAVPPNQVSGDSEEDPTQSGRLRHPVHPELEWRETHHGVRPGEVYVRIMRPSAREFRRLGPGLLVATERTLEPRGGAAALLSRLKRFFIGAPLATTALAHERLSKVKALAVFSSDNLSSVAYATEEIMLVLALAGSAALALSMPIAVAIAALIVVVGTSYRQIVSVLPHGGGAYLINKGYLGESASLVAGACLLIDYVLTVAVSAAAGVAALTSAFPFLYPERVAIGAIFIAVLTVVNLRGIRESGTIFAIPTYLFIGSFVFLIGAGLFQLASGGVSATEPALAGATAGIEPLALLLVLRAFASGCAALTGIEAISDAVPAFKPPETKNAATTLVWMATIVAGFFLGITFLATQVGISPRESETVVSQLARAIHGDGPLYFLTQAFTALILFLAANTSFSGFPILAYFLARDGYLPHQFSFRGDRLAFSLGIVALGASAITLIILFRASTHALIPLYALGVFLAFTLAQASMVKRWWVEREDGWRRGMLINGVGAATTGVVALVIGGTKFALGAWIVVLLIPSLLWMFRAVRRHYQSVEEEQELDSLPTPPDRHLSNTVMVPVPGINKTILRTIAYARTISDHVTAVHVTDNLEKAEVLRDKWEQMLGDVPLVILQSPYRMLIPPLLAYIDAIDQQDPGALITVVLSESIPRHWWQHFLHNQTALRLKGALLFRPNTIVIDVPYHLKR